MNVIIFFLEFWQIDNLPKKSQEGKKWRKEGKKMAGLKKQTDFFCSGEQRKLFSE